MDDKCDINKSTVDPKQETEKPEKKEEKNSEVNKTEGDRDTISECLFIELPYEEDGIQNGKGSSSANTEQSENELNKNEENNDEAKECLFIELPYEEDEANNEKGNNTNTLHGNEDETTDSALFIELPYEEEGSTANINSGILETEQEKDNQEHTEETESVLFIELPYEEEGSTTNKDPGIAQYENQQEKDNQGETEESKDEVPELGYVELPYYEEGTQNEKTVSTNAEIEASAEKEQVKEKTDEELNEVDGSTDVIRELPCGVDAAEAEIKPVRTVVKRGRSLIPRKDDTETAPRNFVDVPDYGYVGIDGSFQVPF